MIYFHRITSLSPSPIVLFRDATCRFGESYAKYSYEAYVKYEVMERVTKTRKVSRVEYRDNYITQYRNDLAHYKKLIFDQRLARVGS